jgi:hypothetical protein
MGPENNTWMDRDTLEQMGFEKMVRRAGPGSGAAAVAAARAALLP